MVVAVWKLDNPTNFTATIAIDNNNEEYNIDSEAIALGWGWTKTGGPGSKVLREVTLPLVDGGQCKKVWDRRGVHFKTSTQLCAGWNEGRKGIRPLIVY